MAEDLQPRAPGLTRRGSLVRLGGFVLAALTAGGWRAGIAKPALTAEAGSGPAAVASGQVSCVLTPELTEGPFYVSNERVRRNITEGRPGAPLLLRLVVVDASTCRPIRNAAVDVWHCDALGVYSGVQGNRGTFMRGVQRTDRNGIARFRTVYPGWYQGRAVHIHVKVHVGGRVVHTGQLFFPDATTDAAYRRAPYRGRGARDTRNPADVIFRNGGRRSMLAIRKVGSAYAGRITLGVQR
jgi:protocatechuate 3,4-dioxygenase beta subunit